MWVCLFLSSSVFRFTFNFHLLIFQESSDPNNILNPCYQEGFNITFSASSIYDTECTKKPKSYKPDQKLTVVGAGDSDRCRSIVKSIFDFKTCSSSQCSFNGVEQPPVTGDFMVRPNGGKCGRGWEDAKPLYTLHFHCSQQAYAGFFYTAKILRLNGTSDLDQFNSSLRNFCQAHWGVVSSSNCNTAKPMKGLDGGPRQ